MRHKAISLVVVLSVAISAVLPSGPAFADDAPKSNQFWWPEQLDLAPLRQHSAESNPMGDDFNYAEAFASLDLDCRQEGHRRPC